MPDDEKTLVEVTAEPDAEAVEQAEQLATARATQQFNAHDVKALEQQVNTLLMALTRLGYTVDQSRLKATADAQTACEILVAHGLATHAEVQSRAYLAARSILAEMLQQAEEATLAAQREAGQLQVARRPGLIVARH